MDILKSKTVITGIVTLLTIASQWIPALKLPPDQLTALVAALLVIMGMFNRHSTAKVVKKLNGGSK